MTIDISNMFNGHKLMYFKLPSGPAFRAKIDESMLLEKGLPPEIIKASKSLLDDRSLLERLSKHDAKLRSDLKKICRIDFPIDAVCMCPINRLPEFYERWNEAIADDGPRANIISEFVNGLEGNKQAFYDKYPEHYDNSKYPSSWELVKKYQPSMFEFTINTSDDNLKKLLEEIKENIYQLIYKELIDRTQVLVNQTVGSAKPHQKSINSFSKFLVDVNETYSDFVDSDNLRNLLDDLKLVLDYAPEASTMRDYDSVRDEFGKLVSKTFTKIEECAAADQCRAIDF